MPFTIRCPSCQARLKTPEALIGKQVKCPGCSHQILVQLAATSVSAPPPAPAATPRAPVPVPPPLPAKPAAAKPPPVPALEIPKQPKAPPPIQLDELEEVEDDEVVVEAEEVEEIEDVQEVVEEDAEVVEENDNERPRGKKPRNKPGPPRRGSSTRDERTSALLIHLLGIPTGFIGPLILWLLKRKESRFLDHHGKEAINFHITNVIVALVFVLLFFVVTLLTAGFGALIMLPVGLGISVYLLILMIIAAFRAKQGAWYRYPGIIHFLR